MKKGFWGELNPLVWPLLSWALTLGSFGMGDVLIWSVGWNTITQVLVACFVITAAVAPFAAMVLLGLSYRENAKRIGRIICLFLALVLLCANINFMLVMHFSLSDSMPFHGIHSVWTEGAAGQRHTLSWGNLFQAIIDCIHFSIVTLSTVGYGDIYPIKWYSKLVVDVEILLGLGITVLTAGRYFSRGGEEV